MADSVQLTDLDVIARYSIAVRSATADRDELIETLRADLTWLERDRRSRPATVDPPVGGDPDDETNGQTDVGVDVEPEAEVALPRAPIRRMPAPKPRVTTARKAAAKKTATKKTATKKTATKKPAAKKPAPRRA